MTSLKTIRKEIGKNEERQTDRENANLLLLYNMLNCGLYLATKGKEAERSQFEVRELTERAKLGREL